MPSRRSLERRSGRCALRSRDILLNRLLEREEAEVNLRVVGRNGRDPRLLCERSGAAYERRNYEKQAAAIHTHKHLQRTFRARVLKKAELSRY